LVICVGLNKTATKTLQVFFKQNFGMNKTIHSPEKFSGGVWFNMNRNVDILNRLKYDFYSDLFFSSTQRVGNYLKSQSFRSEVIKRLYEQYEDMKFIVNYRNLNDWLVSREKHVLKNQNNERYKKRNRDSLWLDVNYGLWKKEYEEHYNFCERFFANKESLWLNVCDGDKPEKIFNFLGMPTLVNEFPKINQSKI